MKSLILFGGTFDPPHAEHVAMAKAAVEEKKPDKIIIMPTATPPHKKTFHAATAKDRLEMCRLAFGDIRGCEVSPLEINAGGKSYSYITVGKLAEKYVGYKIYFLMGTDMLSSFHKWKNPEEILRFCVPLLCVRKGEGETAEETLNGFEEKFSVRPEALSFQGGEASSTECKLRILLGLDAGGLLPESVAKYVVENGVYPSDEYFSYIRTHLKEKRIVHTLGVMLAAKKYAKQANADENAALTAALLHDAAKYEDPADYPDFKAPAGVPEPVMHQYLGAYIAEKVLGVKDEDILNAIKYHTSGRKGMSLLEKIILTADKLERGRKFDGVEELRKIASEDFEKGFKEALYRTSYKYIEKSGKSVYSLTKEALEDYVKEK